MWFNVEMVGLLAGCCTTASFLPQVIHTWRTKSVADISLRMYLLLCLGIFLWLVYGLLVQSLSVILANGVSLLLTLVILTMKWVYGRPGRRLDRRAK